MAFFSRQKYGKPSGWRFFPNVGRLFWIGRLDCFPRFFPNFLNFFPDRKIFSLIFSQIQRLDCFFPESFEESFRIFESNEFLKLVSSHYGSCIGRKGLTISFDCFSLWIQGSASLNARFRVKFRGESQYLLRRYLDP